MKDINEIKSEIRGALEEAAAECRNEDRDTPWTQAIKRRLTVIGHRHRYEVCCSDAGGISDDKAEWGEWLYDLCWLERSGDKFYKRMPLAMESEWDMQIEDEVLPDFQKLVFSGATLRLLVWQNKNHAALRSDVRLFSGQIDAVNGDHAKYLFAGFSRADRKFEFYPL